jgi:hypothetical protein
MKQSLGGELDHPGDHRAGGRRPRCQGGVERQFRILGLESKGARIEVDQVI